MLEVFSPLNLAFLQFPTAVDIGKMLRTSISEARSTMGRGTDPRSLTAASERPVGPADHAG
jgi:hypothetical protein